MATLVRVFEHVAEYSRQTDEPLRWNADAPEACLVTDDLGRAALGLRAHPDDPDPRSVVLSWDGVSYALMGLPNDEAIQQHRLYDLGLKDVDWVGIVRDSALIAQLKPMSAASGEPSHFVVPCKEGVVEVVAGRLDVRRLAGHPRQVASAGLEL